MCIIRKLELGVDGSQPNTCISIQELAVCLGRQQMMVQLLGRLELIKKVWMEFLASECSNSGCFGQLGYEQVYEIYLCVPLPLWQFTFQIIIYDFNNCLVGSRKVVSPCLKEDKEDAQKNIFWGEIPLLHYLYSSDNCS